MTLIEFGEVAIEGQKELIDVRDWRKRYKKHEAFLEISLLLDRIEDLEKIEKDYYKQNEKIYFLINRLQSRLLKSHEKTKNLIHEGLNEIHYELNF